MFLVLPVTINHYSGDCTSRILLFMQCQCWFDFTVTCHSKMSQKIQKSNWTHVTENIFYRFGVTSHYKSLLWRFHFRILLFMHCQCWFDFTVTCHSKIQDNIRERCRLMKSVILMVVRRSEGDGMSLAALVMHFLDGFKGSIGIYFFDVTEKCFWSQ